MIRKLLYLLVAVVVLVVVAIGTIAWNADRVAQSAIELGTTYATGVPTTTNDVNLGVFSGDLTVDQLQLGNPDGFKTPHLLTLGELDVEVALTSLFSDEVRVPKIEMQDLTLVIEEQPDGTNNLSVVMERLQRLGGPDQPERPEQPGRKYRVDRIVIRNVVAEVYPRGIASVTGPLEVPVGDIVLEDVTPDNAQGLAIAELSQRVLPAVVAAVVKKGGGMLPENLAQNLSQDVAKVVEQVGGEATKLIEQVGGQAAEAVGKVSEELGKQVGKTVEDVGRDVGSTIEGILGGKKQPDEQSK